ncbi:hypothetical protein [Aeromicrobium sp.]|uniref:hypothetical protein n=1 Tax=Aeromicrobium sp. TaxID=1871063 RepID=UPI00199DC95F|nr:hypothetical protein [Aeromicrobium sp.]MBC7633692.1 hypothetical protein [Aeromicrobium sp.]
MRSFLSMLSGLVALVALLATIPLLWVSTHVAEEDGYVRFSSVLAKDAELQSTFAAYLGNDLVKRGVLPERLEPAATAALTAVAGRTTSEPGFVGAWEQTQRSFHRSAFAGSSQSDLLVDAGPMASFVSKRVSGALPVQIPVPDRLVVRVGNAQDRQQIEKVQDTTSQSRIGLVVVAVGALGCLLLARRRSVALAWLGLGTVLVAGALRLVSSVAAPRILDQTEAPSAFARTLQKLLVDRASDSLATWLLWVAAGGAVLVVVGVAGRAVLGRSARSS